MHTSHVVYIALALAVSACSATYPAAPSPSSPRTVIVPPLQGLVVDTDGAPIAGATVEAGTHATRSGADGTFALDRSSAYPSQGIVGTQPGYVVSYDPFPAASINSTAVSVTIRLQPRLTVSDGAPLDSHLSGNDRDYYDQGMNWACGPCKSIAVQGASGASVITLETDIASAPWIWTEASNDNYDSIRLTKTAGDPSTHILTATLPEESPTLFYRQIKVGWPPGSRAAGVPFTNFRLTLTPVSGAPTTLSFFTRPAIGGR